MKPLITAQACIHGIQEGGEISLRAERWRVNNQEEARVERRDETRIGLTSVPSLEAPALHTLIEQAGRIAAEADCNLTQGLGDIAAAVENDVLFVFDLVVRKVCGEDRERLLAHSASSPP